MKAIINDNIEIPNITRVNEIIDLEAPQRLVIICNYSQSLFETIVNILPDANIINCKILQDNEILNIYTKYTKFYKIIHHQGIQGEFLELSFIKD